MAITLGTNLAALNASNNLDTTTDQYNKSLQRLASGERIATVGDDPSGSARAAGLQVQVSALGQAKRNVGDAASVINVAEGGLNEINNQLMRLRELSLAAANEEIEPGERNSLSIEANSIVSEIDRLAQSTHYSGKNLLNGDGKALTFQVGPNNSENDRVTFAGGIDATASNLGISGLNIYSPDDALSSIDSVDQAIQKIQSYRAQTGSFASRLNSIDNSLSSNQAALTGALSNVRDTDYAQESSRAMQLDIQKRAQIAVLSHANLDAQNVLKLLGG